MARSVKTAAFRSLAATLVVGAALSGCATFGELSTVRTQGSVLSQEALQQVRAGQSMALVTTVLGSPQSRNTFGEETAFYYVETKVEETAFGLKTVKERTVLTVYFDKNGKVVDKAIYGLQDGKVFAIETRRTPSFGEDRTFIESILKSFTS